MKKTKIVCTIGPASNNEKTLKKMIEAGMNVFIKYVGCWFVCCQILFFTCVL